MHPTAQRSHPLDASLSLNTSGDTYSAVPQNVLVLLSDALSSFAVPKSVIFNCPLSL